ncbi:sarcosine oxidase subunit gamma [Sulfitobacter sp. D35]|uniref:sarcosine oxidase subunit gamma n=1 Tax=Sulfitobacter sp. D35 TaxID=3083252 RepID=UPI00296FC821|nr:sarcosine oxidase subunit gamma [Sulfitobacter sp. D35]MDW4497014.1 sarcosine oxidase subunit gamma [Sulfitobacter sp. D35]
MIELLAKSPCTGFLPRSIGELMLTEAGLGPMATVSPYAGRTERLTVSLSDAFGLDWPESGRSDSRDGRWLIWFGRDAALLTGVAPAANLGEHAAVTDQSDAWAAVELAGPGSEEVLARLVPVDLRLARFERGQTTRTLLGHMNASITRTGAENFLILVFRSMAETLVRELAEAMESVHMRRAEQGELSTPS